ncbi:MAG: phosphoribosylanthranilate isomerase [Pirellulales bacterium]|nr:phosphoribosylanthranilate isomerase [Pirellulales bacterium]
MAQSPADAIGLNFFPSSIRYVDPAQASTVDLARHANRLKLTTVGVFVNESVESIHRVADRLSLDQVQLHGDESLQTAVELARMGHPVIRAVKLPRSMKDDYPIGDAVSHWHEAGCAVLLDADAGTAHGGSGQPLNWSAIKNWSDCHAQRPWILAGGLTPDNVVDAIQRSGARAVDVASGVESPRGTKSAERIQQFANLAAQTLA